MTLDFAEPQKGFDSPCRFGLRDLDQRLKTWGLR